MKIRVEFSWSAPPELLLPPSEEVPGSVPEALPVIERVVQEYLEEPTGIESLDDRFSVSGTTCWIDEEEVLSAPEGESVESAEAIALRVLVESDLRSPHTPEEISSWSVEEIWDEIYRGSSLAEEEASVEIEALC